jgi:hypothetical protein
VVRDVVIPLIERGVGIGAPKTLLPERIVCFL